MKHRSWLLAAGLVVLAAVATNPGGCGSTGDGICDPGGVECISGVDCETLTWNTGACSEAEGRWECLNRECYPVCPGECETTVDCQSRTWPDGSGCSSDEGDWRCEDSFCIAICPGECETALECEGKIWPSHARCLEDDGQWACEETVCVPACPVECRVPVDCEDTPWPANLACPEDEGHWTCRDEVCMAACDVPCSQPSDCTAYDWTLDCIGTFACVQPSCIQLCETLLCGDGNCDATQGETPESCPPDCDLSCATLDDCLGREWDAQCEGRWNCAAEACVEVCDYDSCGDDTCDPTQGENQQTCPRDCHEGCELSTDCYSERWGLICQGRWTCNPLHECQELCDSANCPDGVCWGLNGENEDSCFLDCLGGPCQTLTDCLAHRWYEDFGGHWQCNPPVPPGLLRTGACEAVRDDVGCGDGTCDVLGGETPVSCGLDCSGFTCTKSDDCNTLTLPGGCAGSWICSNLICVPQCE